MQFLTILTPIHDRYQVCFRQVDSTRFFRHFEYELSPDPTSEYVTVGFGPVLTRHLPHELWPDLALGARRGGQEAHARRLRLCCVRVTVLSADHQGLRTSSTSVQYGMEECVQAEVAVRLAEPMPPLRGEWLTSDVVALARGIHANVALDGLPALTDALLEAGCDHPLAIEHLKTCPDHRPSCWVVEMICAQAAARDGTSG